MSKLIEKHFGTGVIAHIANTFAFVVQAFFLIIVFSPIIFWPEVHRWVWPWDWITPPILLEALRLVAVLTVCYGFGSWAMNQNEKRKRGTQKKDRS
jgi:hypothetical protein